MEKKLIIFFVFSLALSNLYLAYQIIELQTTVAELYVMVYENRTVLELLKLFGVDV
jgi:hypothetical protein